MPKITTKELQPEYRPDEKLLAYGASALSDAELLAVIIRTGSTKYNSVELARNIISPQEGSDTSILNIFKYDHDGLRMINGVGKVKALQIQALAELSLRIAQGKARPGLAFNNPDSVANYYMERMRHEKNEKVLLLLLNSSCSLVKEILLSTGTVNGSIVSARDILINAFKYEAVSFILLHNHPSGNPAPSKADILQTECIRKTAQLAGVEFADHIIIGDNCFYSFKKEETLI